MECGLVRQHNVTPYFYPQHTPSWNCPAKDSVVPTQLPLHGCRMFPLLLAQMGMATSAACVCGAAAACVCGAEEKTLTMSSSNVQSIDLPI